jgi:hypothetical protein
MIAAVFVSGCGTRTVRPNEPHSVSDIKCPIYDAPMPVVFDASLLACRSYFHRVDRERKISLAIKGVEEVGKYLEKYSQKPEAPAQQ